LFEEILLLRIPVKSSWEKLNFTFIDLFGTGFTGVKKKNNTNEGNKLFKSKNEVELKKN